VSEQYLQRILNNAPLNLIFQAVQRRALKYDQPRRARISARRERDREYVLGRPGAAIRHVEFPLDPNGRAIVLGVEREPQTIVERCGFADMRAEGSEERAGGPPPFVLFTILSK
jgi:hypothetical protein